MSYWKTTSRLVSCRCCSFVRPSVCSSSLGWTALPTTSPTRHTWTALNSRQHSRAPASRARRWTRTSSKPTPLRSLLLMNHQMGGSDGPGDDTTRDVGEKKGERQGRRKGEKKRKEDKRRDKRRQGKRKEKKRREVFTPSANVFPMHDIHTGWSLSSRP